MNPTLLQRPDRAAPSSLGAIARLIRAVGFWTAVWLPLFYLPIITGLVAVETPVFLGTVALNGLALVVGHGHDPGTL